MTPESISDRDAHATTLPAEKLEANDDSQEEDRMEYPTGAKLVMILVAIFLSLVLTGLVCEIPRRLSLHPLSPPELLPRKALGLQYDSDSIAYHHHTFPDHCRRRLVLFSLVSVLPCVLPCCFKIE